MTDLLPHFFTGELYGPTLWSTQDRQYAAHFSGSIGAGELRVSVRNRDTGFWLASHQMTGAERTALNLPNVDNDGHRSPAIAVDGLGYLHVLANMHGGVTTGGNNDDAGTNNLRCEVEQPCRYQHLDGRDVARSEQAEHVPHVREDAR